MKYLVILSILLLSGCQLINSNIKDKCKYDYVTTILKDGECIVTY